MLAQGMLSSRAVASVMESLLCGRQVCGSVPRASPPVMLRTVALTLELTSALALFVAVVGCQGPMNQGQISIAGSLPGPLLSPQILSKQCHLTSLEMDSRKRLAFAIIQFLHGQLRHGGLSSDAQESLEGESGLLPCQPQVGLRTPQMWGAATTDVGGIQYSCPAWASVFFLGS